MAMDMLRQLASSPLPCAFHFSEEVDKIQLLRAAGLIITLPPTSGISVVAGADTVQVLAITAKGREELARFVLPRDCESEPVVESPSWMAKLAAVGLWRRSKER